MISEHERTEILNDLYGVGTSKSLGYLPLSTLENYCEVSLKEIIEFATTENLEYLLFEQGECNIHSGAIYLYDESMLSMILHENKSVLQEAGVPYDDVLEYITYITKATVYSDKYPEAYVVVGKTFGDKRFK